jgi:hypothetical protein
VKYLPESPNLSYLRQEAKDLLLALRESEPATSLAAAQRSLAEQYGFRTWPELKADVEARRLRQHRGDPELAGRLAASFGLGHGAATVTPLVRDMIGVQCRLETNRGIYLLRQLLRPNFDWISETQVDRAMRLLIRARNAGVSAPTPIRTTRGEWLADVDGERWRADEWMELGPSLAQPASLAAAKTAGQILGAVHGVAMDPGIALSANSHLLSRRPDSDWEFLANVAEQANTPWAPLLRKELPSIYELNGFIADPAVPDCVLCICDLQPGSVRMGAGGVMTVVHWEFAGPMPPAWELAYALVQWTTGPGSPSLSAAKALVDGYRSVAGTLAGLEITSFTSLVASRLNYLARTISLALNPANPNHRFAEAELPGLLARRLSVTDLERLLAAATG